MSDSKQPSVSKQAAPRGAALRLVAPKQRQRNLADKSASAPEASPEPAPAVKAKATATRKRSKLPRGITEVRWENATVRDSVRFRVRINRKGFKADQLFDDFKKAEEFLLSSKTQDGRLGLTEREERAKVVEQVAAEMLSRRAFGFYMNLYVKTFIDPKPAPNEVKKQSKKVVIDRIRGLRSVVLVCKSAEDRKRSGLLAALPAPAARIQRKELSDFFLDEIDENVANDFLQTRRKTHAHSTVERERGQLQTIWTKIRTMDPAAGAKLPYENPWQQADKALNKPEETFRDTELTQEQLTRYGASLGKCRNKIVPLVVFFALATGMRRGEILMLEWRQVKDGFLVLPPAHTKARRLRNVHLTPEALTVIEQARARVKGEVEPNGRVFPITINAFKKSEKTARKRAKLGDFHFHDTRREAITLMLNQMAYPSATQIAAQTGMQSVVRIEQAFIKPWDDRERARTGRMQSEADIRANVGHADARMTKLYANFFNAAAPKVAPESGPQEASGEAPDQPK